MKPKEINIDVLSVKSIDRAIREVEKYKRWLDTRTKLFIKRLQEVGVDAALMYFKKATYAGEPDVLIDPPGSPTGGNGRYTARVRATGSTVLFIEFGTGIYYENAHQLAYGFAAGSYGEKALQPWGWFYSGTPGMYAPRDTEMAKGRRNTVHTFGNPANMPMYNTRRQLLILVGSIAEEVFCR